jgi:hypothetical protein
MAGCSSTRIDTGAIAARSFNFIHPQGRPLPNYAENQKEVHSLVQSAISKNLSTRQVKPVAQGGDITVAYLIVAGNNAVTTSINDYFGYGRDAEKLVNAAHKKYTGNDNPNYFEAGTLLIDVIDSKSWKVLYRGYATRALQPNATPEQRTARVQAAVDEILGRLRFKQ